MTTGPKDAADVTWRDELVELHVLAEHGDAGALATAQRWLSTDPRARAVWDTVTRDCAELIQQVDPGRPVGAAPRPV